MLCSSKFSIGHRLCFEDGNLAQIGYIWTLTVHRNQTQSTTTNPRWFRSKKNKKMPPQKDGGDAWKGTPIGSKEAPLAQWRCPSLAVEVPQGGASSGTPQSDTLRERYEATPLPGQEEVPHWQEEVPVKVPLGSRRGANKSASLIDYLLFVTLKHR